MSELEQKIGHPDAVSRLFKMPLGPNIFTYGSSGEISVFFKIDDLERERIDSNLLSRKIRVIKGLNNDEQRFTINISERDAQDHNNTRLNNIEYDSAKNNFTFTQETTSNSLAQTTLTAVYDRAGTLKEMSIRVDPPYLFGENESLKETNQAINKEPKGDRFKKIISVFTKDQNNLITANPSNETKFEQKISFINDDILTTINNITLLNLASLEEVKYLNDEQKYELFHFLNNKFTEAVLSFDMNSQLQEEINKIPEHISERLIQIIMNNTINKLLLNYEKNTGLDTPLLFSISPNDKLQNQLFTLTTKDPSDSSINFGELIIHPPYKFKHKNFIFIFTTSEKGLFVDATILSSKPKKHQMAALSKINTNNLYALMSTNDHSKWQHALKNFSVLIADYPIQS